MGFLDGIGDVLGPVLGYVGQRQANDANKDIAHNANVMSQQNAREQMQFQERMSNTSHAREVADLKNAGLNPILSVNAGAPAPSGASGSVTTGAPQQNAMASLMSNAIEMKQLRLAMAKQDKELALMDSQKNKLDIDAKVASKGIPAADVTNRLYNLTKPVLEKLEGWQKSKATPVKDFLLPKATHQYDPKSRSYQPVPIGPKR